MKNDGLEVPKEYYPRYIEIVSTKENLFAITPCGWWKAKFSSAGRVIFSNVFVVVFLVLVSLILPVLNRSASDYYIYLSGAFFVSYLCSKVQLYISTPMTFSVKWVAQHLGYKSDKAPLKPFDERMIRDMAKLNNYILPRGGLIFDDMYSFLFDKFNPRRTLLLVKPKLRVVN